MHSIPEFLQEPVSMLYTNASLRDGTRGQRDMSHSNRCDTMSFELYTVLSARGILCRRELHMDGQRRWHYLVAHAAPDAVPSQQDIVTDLNPWQFEEIPHHSGPLHGKRLDVQITLGEAGAPAWFVGLRGIASILEAHTLEQLAKGLPQG